MQGGQIQSMQGQMPGGQMQGLQQGLVGGGGQMQGGLGGLGGLGQLGQLGQVGHQGGSVRQYSAGQQPPLPPTPDQRAR